MGRCLFNLYVGRSLLPYIPFDKKMVKTDRALNIIDVNSLVCLIYGTSDNVRSIGYYVK